MNYFPKSGGGGGLQAPEPSLSQKVFVIEPSRPSDLIETYAYDPSLQ